MLESLDQINIGRLNLEEPAPPAFRPPFDPEREISQGNRDLITEVAASKLGTAYDIDALNILASMSVLFPNEQYDSITFKEIPATADPLSPWNRALSHLNEYRNTIRSTSPRDYDFSSDKPPFLKWMNLLTTLKELSPKQFANNVNVDSVYDIFETALKANRGTTEQIRTLEICSMAKILYPDDPAFDLRESESLGLMAVQSVFLKSGAFLEIFANRAAAMRIMSEEYFKNLNLIDSDWERLKAKLRITGDRLSDHIFRESITTLAVDTEYAADLKILSAHHLQIDQNGLQLFMTEAKPASFQSVTPSLPEVRKF